MKKVRFLFLFTLAILFLLQLAIAESVVVVDQVKFDRPIGQSGENPKAVMVDNTLYIFSRKEGYILSWRVGDDNMGAFSMLPQAPIESIAIAYKDMDEKKRAEMNQVVTHIIAGDGKLWALNQYSGKFGEITENGVEYTHDFDLRNLNPELRYDEDYRFPGFVYKNTLYLFSVMKKEMFFAKYNLKGNEREDAPLAKSMGVAYLY